MAKEREMTGDNISVINFAAIPLPDFKETKNLEYVKFGSDNNYPNYLIELLNRSAKHNAILTGKVHYITGRGFAIKESVEEVAVQKIIQTIKNINSDDTIDELLYKHVTDLELFGSMAVQVIPRADGKGWAQLQHLDKSKIRTNKDKTRIFWCEEWSNGSTSFKPKPEDIKELQIFNEKTFSGVLIYDQYRAGMKVYPLPEYIGAINYIEIDAQIANFHLSNLQNGFSAGTMISFNNGNTSSPEERKIIENKLKSKFTGTDNAGQIVITYSNGKDSAPTVVPLQSNNFEKLYETLGTTTQNEIFVGHKITSGLLFGIKEAGSLGGNKEIRELWELFKNGYVNAKQQIVTEFYNYLFSLNGFDKPLMIEDIEPIGFEVSESTMLQVLSKDEIRARLGELPSEKPENPAVERTLNALNSLSPLVATKVLERMTDTEIRALAQLPKATEPIAPPTVFENEFSEDEIIEIFSSVGVEKKNYKIHDSIDVANKDESFLREVEFYRNAFAKKDEEKKVDIAPTISTKVLWSYELASSAPPLVKGGTSRPFCKKMVALDRLYSRQDIDFISSKLGYDVWSMRGGFYHNPKYDVTTKFCRHIWKQNIVSNV